MNSDFSDCSGISQGEDLTLPQARASKEWELGMKMPSNSAASTACNVAAGFPRDNMLCRGDRSRLFGLLLMLTCPSCD